MMVPARRASIDGRKALVTLNTPRTFTAIRRSRSAPSVCISVPTWPTPALFTSTSRRSCRCRTASAQRAHCASSETSRASIVAVRPVLAIRSRVASAVRSSRSVTTTWAPAAANASAMAAPMPDPAPVTSAIFPVRSNIRREAPSRASSCKVWFVCGPVKGRPVTVSAFVRAARTSNRRPLVGRRQPADNYQGYRMDRR